MHTQSVVVVGAAINPMHIPFGQIYADKLRSECNGNNIMCCWLLLLPLSSLCKAQRNSKAHSAHNKHNIHTLSASFVSLAACLDLVNGWLWRCLVPIAAFTISSLISKWSVSIIAITAAAKAKPKEVKKEKVN